MKSNVQTVLLWLVSFIGYAVLFYVISSVFDLILGTDEPVTWSSHIKESLFFGLFFTIINKWFEKKRGQKNEEEKGK